jgi:hypothetical protein
MFAGAPSLDHDDLVTGERLVGACDAVWFHYERRPFTVGRDARIFYSDTIHAEELFEQLARIADRRLVAVTHNSDRGATAELLGRLPAHVAAWHAQNVCHADPRLHPLPIGLENERWFPELRKKQKILGLRAARVTPTRLLYVNHAIATNPTTRQRPYDLFAGEPWCTAVHGKNGSDFDGYLQGIADHFFVLSPPGNGVDCHRTWEVLYAGRVPILLRGPYTALYRDLPVLLVDDWSEVTERRLRDEQARLLDGRYDFDKLRLGYWRRQIRGEAGRPA